jgi:autotransporter-associated beta strand protein
VNDGVLAINRSDTLTLGSAVGGTGSLAQIGSGTTILTGANSYGGGTTIAARTLQVGTGGTTGPLGAGAIVNNGVLAINRSDRVTVSGDISGTGGLTQMGPGTTILTGTNAYSGPTTILAGLLQIGNGGVAGTLGNGSVVNLGDWRSMSVARSRLPARSAAPAQSRNPAPER